MFNASQLVRLSQGIPHGQKLLYQQWVLKIDHSYPPHEPVVFPSLIPTTSWPCFHPPLPRPPPRLYLLPCSLQFLLPFPPPPPPLLNNPAAPPPPSPIPWHTQDLHRGTICRTAGGPSCHEGKNRQQTALRGELDFLEVCVLLCTQEIVNLAWKQFSFKTTILSVQLENIRRKKNGSYLDLFGKNKQ